LVIVGTVGSGISDVDRVQLYKKFSTIKKSSDYKFAGSNGVLCHWIEPQLATIKCSNILIHDQDGSLKIGPMVSINTMYSIQGMYFAPKLIHPRFEKLRDDKTWFNSANLNQFTQHITISSDEINNSFINQHSIAKAQYSTASIIKKYVYSKKIKNKVVSIKKFYLIKTDCKNRAKFIVQFTDYSENRSQPLKRQIKTAHEIIKANTLIGSWIKKEIKSGWEKIS